MSALHLPLTVRFFQRTAWPVCCFPQQRVRFVGTGKPDRHDSRGVSDTSVVVSTRVDLTPLLRRSSIEQKKLALAQMSEDHLQGKPRVSSARLQPDCHHQKQHDVSD
jgi:hypothetical protein